MPTIHDEPPSNVKAELARLRADLTTRLPAKSADNLLIGTWNIRGFGGLTDKWTATGDDSPKRDLRGLLAITEIISRFDVVAVQEVKGDLRALRHMLKKLGSNWSFVMTDITRGDAGHGERLAFVFDRTRVQLSGLAAEIVVPPEWIEEEDIGEDALRTQFVRTPYAVSFRAGSTTFILVALHVLYGDRSAERIPELQGIARWMDDWAKKSNRWHHNLLALGDFNIDRKGDALWRAFTSTGLTVPDQLNDSPRSIFADPDEPTLDKFYDQIAWFTTGSGKRRLQMELVDAGHYDFVPLVYQDTDLTKRSMSYRLSDHYPLWAEFKR